MFGMAGVASADTITIDLEDLAAGAQLFDQYSADGIHFRDQLLLTGNSPGLIASSGYASAMALQPNQYASPMFILLDNSATAFNLYKFEASETVAQPPEEQQQEQPQEQQQEQPQEEAPPPYTVHLEFFKFDGSAYQSIGTIQNSDKDAWVQVSFTSVEQISAIKIYGTLPYSVDNMQFETTSTPVPEPATMLLMGTGLAGLVGSKIRRRKNVL